MKINIHKNPRKFKPIPTIELKDMGDIILEENEQITFKTRSNKTNDITRKEWGFYLTNSINHTLKSQGLKTALVFGINELGARFYINLVEIKKMDLFNEYLKKFNSRVVCWLDEWRL